MLRASRVLVQARGMCVHAPHSDLPNLNVCTVGAFRHGKSTLTSALTRMAKDGHVGLQFWAPQDLDKTASERAAGHGQHATHVEWAHKKCRSRGYQISYSTAYTRNIAYRYLC